MQDIKRLRGFVLLAIGIALLAYSLLAITSLMASSRAVLMMGSAMQPGGSVTADRATAAVFLIFLNITGLVLVGISARLLIASYRKQEGKHGT